MQKIPLSVGISQQIEFDGYLINVRIGTDKQVFISVEQNDEYIVAHFRPCINVPIYLKNGNYLVVVDTRLNDNPISDDFGNRWVLLYA